MQIGKLRHRLTRETRDDTLDERGQQASTYTATTPVVWGSIETLSGRELEAARKLFAEATHRVTIRYLDAVTVRDRFRFGSRIFHPGHIDNLDQRNIWLVMTCVEDL